jgi:hypothetical protein
VITTTTTTATSPAITPAAINTTYWTKLTLIMDPGTSEQPDRDASTETAGMRPMRSSCKRAAAALGWN